MDEEIVQPLVRTRNQATAQQAERHEMDDRVDVVRQQHLAIWRDKLGTTDNRTLVGRRSTRL